MSVALWSDGWDADDRARLPHLALRVESLDGDDALVTFDAYRCWQRVNGENDRNGTWSPDDVHAGDGALVHWIEGVRFIHVVAGIVDGVPVYRIADRRDSWGLHTDDELDELEMTRGW